MRNIRYLIVFLVVIFLTACGSSGPVYNFQPRKDDTYISQDGFVIIEYKTNSDGKLIEINIDRFLTIEQMFILSPTVDYDYELEGFDGDIYTVPRNSCTNYNGIQIPINLEVGNTRYKYDDTRCQYRVVDNYNEFKSGFSANFVLDIRETIQESKNTKISVIVYDSDELVPFIELFDIPSTVESLGLYSIILNPTRDDFRSNLINYYRDMGIYEQLYLKHQANDDATDEILGITMDINLADLTDISNLTDYTPLVDGFEDIYEREITAIEELQDEIGTNFDDEEEPTGEDEEPAGDENT